MNSSVILGLNGVRSRDHDASACLIIDGEIVAAAEQERFSRRKKAFDEYPVDTIAFCLDKAGIVLADVDTVTIAGERAFDAPELFLPERFRGQVEEVKIVQYGHHESHAASTFYTSGFSESAILVLDGEGEGESSSIWLGNSEGLKRLATFDVSTSLGYLYSSISKFCGLGTFGAGKVMGLAPYGEPIYIDIIRRIHKNLEIYPIKTQDSQDEFIGKVISELEKKGLTRSFVEYSFDRFNQKTKKTPELSKEHIDLAASVQKYLEEEILKLAKEAHELTGSDNLCMAGGVAMNCVANSAVENASLFHRIHLQPACEDNGIALGSALLEHGDHVEFKTPYLGPSFSDKEIATYLASVGIDSTLSDDISVDTAQMLAGGEIIGWFQGGLEYGPRALGNRSIIANPSIDEMHKKVSLVKRRELWRPFGPSVIESSGEDLFYKYSQSPYMLKSFLVKPEWRNHLSAVVHVDGSTRPQTVTEPQNPRYYGLIKHFYELTGIPAVLNTSFNDDTEPVVCTPQDAVKIFFTTNLDVLVLGNQIVRKHKK